MATLTPFPIPQFEAKAGAGKPDVDIVAIYQDAGMKALPPKGSYGPHIQKLRKAEVFMARASSFQFIRFGGRGAESCLFAGLGVPADLTAEKLRLAGATAWSRLCAERAKTVLIHADSFFGAKGLRAELTPIVMIRAFTEGLAMAAYDFAGYKSGPKKETYQGPKKISVKSKDPSLKKDLALELAHVRAIGEAVRVTRDWSNEPSNHGTPEFYAAQARKLAKEHGLSCKVLTEKDAEKEKMGLFLGVGQGSEREGRIVVLEYLPKSISGGPKGKENDSKTICFVGKGVTFDSGGISIKPAQKMEDMKHDMTGAATVMGATLLAAAWKVPNRIVTILAFTENMPDGGAIQPGNVLTSRSGKTVEIINTDAEGRLILADVLDYAQDLKPDAIIDAATLTGAVTIALGKQCCGIMGNHEPLIAALRRAGDASGERIWQLPLYDEYFNDLKSDVADMKNSANDPGGGTIRGGIFLKQFIRKGTAWAHLDIAATAWGMGHLPYYPKKGASGAYVRSLARFAADFRGSVTESG